MRGTLPPARPERGSLTVQAVGALRALGRGGPQPILLGYHPTARNNPFQALLYQRALEARIVPLPVPDEETIPELVELARLGHRVVLHLHWLNRPLGRATSAADAARAGEAFLARIDEVHEAGGRVVWTVHNILPHATRFEDEERRFRGAVAGRVDLIHVMAAGTRDLVAPWFDLPADRLLHVPHPNYVGAYPDIVTRDQARRDLDVLPDEVVYLLVGAIMPYKGIGELLDAWADLPRDGVPRRLVIAGAPSHGPEVEEILGRAMLDPTVLLHAQRIEIDQMQVFLRAADVAVLPYLRALNSGAQLLALSFGLPVVVPAGGGLAEIVDDANGRLFEPGSRTGLVDALVGATALATPAGRAAALATARRHDTAELSRRFAEGLRDRLTWEPTYTEEL